MQKLMIHYRQSKMFVFFEQLLRLNFLTVADWIFQRWMQPYLPLPMLFCSDLATASRGRIYLTTPLYLGGPCDYFDQQDIVE